MEPIDYSISTEEEKEPVGNITYHDTEECIKYYSEKDLLDHFKEALNFLGYMGVTTQIYLKDGQIRHGLRYAILEARAGEFCLDYAKEEYEKSYVYKTQKESER